MSYRPRWSMSLLLVVMLGSACDLAPTAPEAASLPPAATRPLLAEAPVLQLSQALDDVVTRVLAALDEDARPALERALAQTSSALATREPDRLEAARREIERALVAFDEPEGLAAMQPDLAIIRLLLEQIERALAEPAPQSQEPPRLEIVL